jgi:hypothetical protein
MPRTSWKDTSAQAKIWFLNKEKGWHPRLNECIRREDSETGGAQKALTYSRGEIVTKETKSGARADAGWGKAEDRE